MIKTYKIRICKECRRQVEWRPTDRLSFSWQCPNHPSGYRYLTKEQVEVIKVVPL